MGVFIFMAIHFCCIEKKSLDILLNKIFYLPLSSKQKSKMKMMTKLLFHIPATKQLIGFTMNLYGPQESRFSPDILKLMS